MKAADETGRTREIWNRREHIAVTIAAVGEHHDHSSFEFFKISSSSKTHPHRHRRYRHQLVVAHIASAIYRPTTMSR